MSPLGDVRKGNDDALDPVVLGAVGKDATKIAGARLGFDLLLDRPRVRSTVLASLARASSETSE